MGLDLGDQRIGVAVCDAARRVATPVTTIQRVGDRSVEHDHIADVVAEHDAVLVVVGLPLSLSGEVGPAARKVLTEVKRLRKRLGIEVVTHDERLSTVHAEGSLRHQGVKGAKRRAVVDQVAASVILQGWLDTNLT